MKDSKSKMKENINLPDDVKKGKIGKEKSLSPDQIIRLSKWQEKFEKTKEPMTIDEFIEIMIGV